jgi:hypothetical protein
MENVFILQTLQEFINNPMGKGSNAIPSRQLIKDDLDRRFNSLFHNNEKQKKIDLDVYKDKNEYYFHFKIPSEGKDRQNTYDVVFHFTVGDQKELANDKDLRRYFVKFFSNSPSFTYTYAYAFNLYGLFVEGLADKFRPETFNNPPVTRNPGEIISYEKTIYFAAHYLLLESKNLNKMSIDAIAKPFKEEVLLKKVRNTDKIALEIKQDEQRVRRDKEKESKTGREETKRSNSQRGTVSSKEKIGGQSKIQKIQAKEKITPRAKITPRKSSITKIKPR